MAPRASALRSAPNSLGGGAFRQQFADVVSLGPGQRQPGVGVGAQAQGLSRTFLCSFLDGLVGGDEGGPCSNFRAGSAP